MTIQRAYQKTSYFDFRSANYTKINSYLSAIPWDSVWHYCSDVNMIWSALKNYISFAMEKFIPRRSTGRRAFSRPPHISHAYAEKLKNWRRWRSTGLEADHLRYNRSRTRCRDMTNRHRLFTEKLLVQDGNLGRFYRYINQSLRPNQSCTCLQLNDGTMITDTAEIANTYN